MDDGTGRCSRILIATFYFSLISALCSCGSNLSQQNNTDSTVVNEDTLYLKNADVSVREAIPGTPISYDSTKRYIYITLDDGPQPGTMNCYHLLLDLNVKASFFMIGVQGVEQRSKLKVDSIRDAYPQFLLCNHTYTHAFFNKYKYFYSHTDSALQDLEKAQVSLRVPIKIFRTPANNSWALNGRLRSPDLTKAFCRTADSAGYKGIGWDVVWNFKGCTTPVQSVNEMLREVNAAFDHNEEFIKNHLVILAHDRMFQKGQYADSLSKFITMLKQDPRNVFETIDHYPGVASNN
ncbi:polysaccharide deacetylase family protein [Panacibacter ginsenosidivorans]|uniref:Polysaccharide deacetylase family protein n=1 Tax=Panacibacter ginsenosidivorans TaxID=1813871 RepID=A0A5B8VE24_9BACT|nr:polysaccharide deacetylase family protein [Panacibacter ginsenosidivorans]QEC68518.1 polysaccharide deacetylase family protein [Panacibacter ginsenosidivorans]